MLGRLVFGLVMCVLAACSAHPPKLSAQSLSDVPIFAIAPDAKEIRDCALDSVMGTSVGVDVVAVKSTALHLEGWAADKEQGQVPQKVQLELRGKTGSYFVSAKRGLERPDVVAAFANQRLLYSGYTVDVDVKRLPMGTYRVYVHQQDKGHASVCDTTRSLQVK
jgi:hypothetical protein